MKRNTFLTLVCLFSLMTLFTIAPFVHAEEETIEGMVVEDEWDEEGNLIGVALSGGSGYYIVKNSGMLIDHLGKTVEATGTVSETEDGDMVINVSKFTVLDEE